MNTAEIVFNKEVQNVILNDFVSPRWKLPNTIGKTNVQHPYNFALLDFTLDPPSWGEEGEVKIIRKDFYDTQKSSAR